ncbi:MAG: sugar ABC transporter permease, partial [Candidatus Rokubacteria bacterium]|nr:sugar ABC transporter permease [Candidatus Rokubacteria bacterium]
MAHTGADRAVGSGAGPDVLQAARAAELLGRARARRPVLAVARPYLYILPTFLFLAVFTHYPIVKTFYLSLFKWNLATPQMEFVGLRNYLQAWSTPLFWQVLENNLLFALLTIPLSLALGLALALLINQKIRGLAIYRAALFYPTIIPMAAGAMIWLWILTPSYGLVNYYGRALGLPDVHWLGHSDLALPALAAVGVWKRLGYSMVVFLAGLQMVPEHLYEAAVLEGAGPWQRFWRITLPLLSPTTFFVGLMAVIDSFQAIDQVYLMTQGGPGNHTNIFVFYIYQHAFRFFDLGYASAVSGILFLILLGLTVLAFGVL